MCVFPAHGVQYLGCLFWLKASQGPLHLFKTFYTLCMRYCLYTSLFIILILLYTLFSPLFTLIIHYSHLFMIIIYSSRRNICVLPLTKYSLSMPHYSLYSSDCSNCMPLYSLFTSNYALVCFTFFFSCLIIHAYVTYPSSYL